MSLATLKEKILSSSTDMQKESLTVSLPWRKSLSVLNRMSSLLPLRPVFSPPKKRPQRFPLSSFRLVILSAVGSSPASHDRVKTSQG